MIKVFSNPVILITKDEVITYHHVWDLDSGMCYLTNREGKVIYSGLNTFEVFLEND